jgi:hypothetical protein
MSSQEKIVTAIKLPIPVKAYQTSKPLVIHTLEGDMSANVGDWIIIGSQGEQWPVRQDIFKKTYKIITSDRP